MGTVLSNERLTDGVYHLKVETNSGGAMGQFYMLRAWGAYPILSRPLSIHEVHEDSVEFLYHVVGEGTEIFSRLGSGDSVELEGPFGNGFPQVEGRLRSSAVGSELHRFIIVRSSFRGVISFGL